MKKFLFFLSTFLLLFGYDSFASHVVGGQMTYKYISTTGTNRTYQLELVVYGDCSGGSYYTFGSTTAASVVITNNGATVQTLNIPIIGAESNILISPVCATQQNSTTCNTGTLPGVKKYTFRTNITLNGTSSNWRFAFNGNLVGGTNAGRSNIIRNCTAIGTFMIAATLNNTTGENTSPSLTAEPVPFFCIGVPSAYGLGAVDPDLDNLSYNMIPAITNVAGTATVTYSAGYSATAPLSTVPGTFTFSSATGIAEFTPVNSTPPATPNWAGIVVNEVVETRNGIVVGTCTREMLFAYLNTCSNTAPSTPVGNVGNGELLQSSTQNSVEFRTCEAQQVNFQFTVSPVDPQSDNITVTGTNIPTAATFTVTNNGTPNPTVNFDWNLAAVPAGTYQFYITYKDDGCPLSSVKTVSYTVYIQAFSGNFGTGSQQPCREDSNGFAYINPAPGDTALYKYTWMDPAFNILQTTAGLQSYGDTLYNLLPGIYLVEAENYRGCKRRFNVMVDSPTYDAHFEVDSITCINSSVNFNPNYSNSEFSSWSWDFGNGTSSNAQFPVISYPSAGNYLIKLVATTSIGCVDSFEQWITVDDMMNPVFNIVKPNICVGQKIDITTDLGANSTGLNWDFGDGGALHTEPVTGISYTYPTPGVYTVTMTSTYRSCPNAVSSKTVIVNDIPKVNLGYDTGICYQGSPIVLKNLSIGSGSDLYRWTTGETSSTITVSHPGTYALTVSRNDCAASDSVVVKKDCYLDIPNAFIPGSGDGTGYFLPRTILSRGVSKFDMTIYNRWGERVFFTDNPDGRGWDGNFNGLPQAQGVYIYQINVIYKDARTEKYSGNVTLMR